MQLQTLIDTYAPEQEQRSETCCLHRGGTFQDRYGFADQVPTSFHEVEEWQDGFYRSVWISREELAIITYCEGDVDVSKHESLASFLAELERAERFYAALRED